MTGGRIVTTVAEVRQEARLVPREWVAALLKLYPNISGVGS